MESIKRMVLLLKPSNSALLGNGGTVKLQSFKEGVSVYFKSDTLKHSSYMLYLFLSAGRDLKEYYAGEIKGREFYATLYGVSIDAIKGAAVISSSNNGGYDFILRSNGPDWGKIIERFRISSSQKNARNFGAAVQRPEKNRFTEEKEESDNIENGAEKESTEPLRDETEDENIDEFTEDDKKKDGLEDDIKVQEPDLSSLGNVLKTEGIEENDCDSCPLSEAHEKINPFPDIFPNSEWIKVSYPGPAGLWHYLSGKIYRNGAVAVMAIGVPGEYGIAPPIWLEGFNTYLRTPAGSNGYWLMFQDVETGEALDMDRSLHGG